MSTSTGKFWWSDKILFFKLAVIHQAKVYANKTTHYPFYFTTKKKKKNKKNHYYPVFVWFVLFCLELFDIKVNEVRQKVLNLSLNHTLMIQTSIDHHTRVYILLFFFKLKCKRESMVYGESIDLLILCDHNAYNIHFTPTNPSYFALQMMCVFASNGKLSKLCGLYFLH